MKRVFIGIKASNKIETQAALWRAGKSDWPVRWVGGNNLHLTLVPPFYCGDIDDVAKKIIGTGHGPSIDLKEEIPIKIRYKTISFGPRPHNCRLIWAVGEASGGLVKLKKKIDELTGTKPDQRDFLPHLTLARFRPEDFRKMENKDLHDRIDWEEEINSIEIFESQLTPQGAEYTMLKSINIINP